MSTTLKGAAEIRSCGITATAANRPAFHAIKSQNRQIAV
jgi:hypothetical protein